MRGKALPLADVGRCDGITPAYAGKRKTARLHTLAQKDHPRVCGEKFYVDEVLPGDTGSPPRMRGKVSELVNGRTCYGITPAYAGKRMLKC